MINFIFLVFFILDRIFKYLALNEIKKVFFIKLFLFKNKGIALGIPLFYKLFYFILFLIFSWVVFNLIKSFQEKKMIQFFSLEAVLIGAISNLIDRLNYGAVIDYFSIPFTVLNLSDLMIFFGIIIFGCFSLLKSDKH